MNFLTDAERELYELHERHSRELWALTRRLLSRTHEHGRRLGQRAESARPAAERDLPAWLAAREPVRGRQAVAGVRATAHPTPEKRPTRFRLPWAGKAAKRAASS